ncbi:MAG: membrane integrity-associated transporter subunit PqiC [Candidatus Methylomirabilia bacterium]
MRRFVLSVAVVTVSASLLAGCAGKSSPSKFYTLSSLHTAETGRQVAAAKDNIAIAVGPLELPEYLNRPEIVNRASPNKLDLAAFDRWAEPLRKNFSRVLADNLSVLLATDRVLMFPWGTTPVDYQVVMEVTRFEGQPDGSASLIARWSLFDKDGKAVVMRTSSYTEPAGGEDPEGMVSALSRTLAALSRDIAAAIKAD